MSYATIAKRLGSEPIPFLHSRAPKVQPRRRAPAARRRKAAVQQAAPASAIAAAYSRLVERSQTENVFISALATEAGVTVPQVHAYITDHPCATLAEGDWSYASPEQRAAHMMLRERRRLYVRFD